MSPAGRYRVVVNNYMASGGDGLSGFTEGTDITDKGIIDLDALVDWVAKGQNSANAGPGHGYRMNLWGCADQPPL